MDRIDYPLPGTSFTERSFVTASGNAGRGAITYRSRLPSSAFTSFAGFEISDFVFDVESVIDRFADWAGFKLSVARLIANQAEYEACKAVLEGIQPSRGTIAWGVQGQGNFIGGASGGGMLGVSSRGEVLAIANFAPGFGTPTASTAGVFAWYSAETDEEFTGFAVRGGGSIGQGVGFGSDMVASYWPSKIGGIEVNLSLPLLNAPLPAEAHFSPFSGTVAKSLGSIDSFCHYYAENF